MVVTTLVGWTLLSSGFIGLATVLVLYPLWMLCTSAGRDEEGNAEGQGSDPAVGLTTPDARITIIVAAHNGSKLIAEKLKAIQESTYPHDSMDVVVSSDGSTEDLRAVIAPFQTEHEGLRVSLLHEADHLGKHAALNRAVEVAEGEILVFSDADALPEPRALEFLVAPFSDRQVGGVCGRRVVGEQSRFAQDGQSSYISLDSRLKQIESRSGSITSNDGKLYAVRKGLVRSYPPGVTDDLWASMQVVASGNRFIFEERARAHIRVPSRSIQHELQRRRRIVSRSLRGIWLSRRVLNPFRFGRYSIGLAINKVGRRLIPLFLLVALAGVVLIALSLGRFALPLIACLLVAVALFAFPWASRLRAPAALRKVLSAGHYFFIGNLGALLGVFDLLFGKSVTKWHPKKSG